MEQPKIIAWDESAGIVQYFPNTKKTPWHIEKFELERGVESVMRFSLISRHLRWLQGEILTVLEASIDDERRLKASKDLVKDKISAKISWVYEQCGMPESEEYALSDFKNEDNQSQT